MWPRSWEIHRELTLPGAVLAEFYTLPFHNHPRKNKKQFYYNFILIVASNISIIIEKIISVDELEKYHGWSNIQLKIARQKAVILQRASELKITMT